MRNAAAALAAGKVRKANRDRQSPCHRWNTRPDAQEAIKTELCRPALRANRASKSLAARNAATAPLLSSTAQSRCDDKNMTIRGKTISDYFSRSEPQVRQVISNMLLAPNARERVVWMKRLQRDQASLAHEMQQFIARIGTTRSADLSDAERRMFVHKFESLSARAMEMGDAMIVAMKMP